MTVAVSRELRAELEQGATLPASWYSDRELLRVEHERIFRRAWQYVGPTSNLQGPGSFFTARVGDVPVVVVLDGDGVLRAFVNVCRHRGHEVAEGCGRRVTLQCPYHAWTYGLDGSLRAAPRSEREPDFDRADWGLLPMLVETWGPMVFANVDLDAAPLAETLGSLPEEMRAAGVDPVDFEYRGRSRELVIEANWKIVVENFLECYHCPVAHKSFSKLIDVAPDAYRLTKGRWSSSQYGPAQESGNGLPYDPVGAIRQSQFHYVWPNWTLNVLPGPPHVRVLVFQPLDAERTATFVDGFWEPGTPEAVIDEIVEFGAVVGKEDVALVESVHRGLRSGALPRGRLLLDSEHLLQHFQLLVHDALTDA